MSDKYQMIAEEVLKKAAIPTMGSSGFTTKYNIAKASRLDILFRSRRIYYTSPDRNEYIRAFKEYESKGWIKVQILPGINQYCSDELVITATQYGSYMILKKALDFCDLVLNKYSYILPNFYTKDKSGNHVDLRLFYGERGEFLGPSFSEFGLKKLMEFDQQLGFIFACIKHSCGTLDPNRWDLFFQIYTHDEVTYTCNWTRKNLPALHDW